MLNQTKIVIFTILSSLMIGGLLSPITGLANHTVSPNDQVNLATDLSRPSYQSAEESDTDDLPPPLDETGWVDWQVIAAQTLGLDRDTFQKRLATGQTISQLAEAQGVEPQEVAQTILADEEQWHQQQVAEGVMTQYEAHQSLTSVKDGIAEYLNQSVVDWYALAADLIDLPVATLWDEIYAGQSMAAVAQAHQVDPTLIINQIIEAERQVTQSRLTGGAISEIEADRWLADLPATVRQTVEEGVYVSSRKIDGQATIAGDSYLTDEAWVNWHEVAAQTIGLDSQTLWDELATGQSIAEVAATNGGDPAAVSQAIIEAEASLLQTQMTDQTLTPAKFDQQLTDLQKRVDQTISQLNPVDWSVVAAKTIGLAPTVLEDQLVAGQSIAELATVNNVEPQTVVRAIIAAESRWIEQQVTNERVSPARANQWRIFLATDARHFVNQKFEQ